MVVRTAEPIWLIVVRTPEPVIICLGPLVYLNYRNVFYDSNSQLSQTSLSQTICTNELISLALNKYKHMKELDALEIGVTKLIMIGFYFYLMARF